ncbi:MAG: esterase family protein [Mycobacteriaceae bacterium]|nr:esterase family protein [Mycobacteriaceae bacterium]
MRWNARKWRSDGRRRGRRIVTALAAALVLPVAAGVAGTAVAGATPGAPVHQAPNGGYQELLIPSSMGPIKVQVQWARRGGNAALILLDGMEARNDRNAWSFETNAMRQFANDNLTLVMPVGGRSSLYTDWYGTSNFNGQQVTYKWETFLTKELPAYLGKLGVSPNNYGIAGLSMAGSSALATAAYHRNQFKFAASFSGALNISAPGMREAMRLALLKAGGYNIDAMWGPPWGPGWLRNDPFVFAPRLRGMSMYISSGDGIPQLKDFAMGPVDLMSAMGIEIICALNTRAFQARMQLLNIAATYDFGWTGVHSWSYWQDELWHARNQILDALHAH